MIVTELAKTETEIKEKYYKELPTSLSKIHHKTGISY